MYINDQIVIGEEELEENYLAGSGPGGQNVNKVAAAVQMRFNAAASASLPPDVRHRFLTRYRSRLSKDGVLVLNANRFRHRDRNRQEARARLAAMIVAVLEAPKPRKATRPTLASKKRRLDGKTQRAQIKRNRGKPGLED